MANILYLVIHHTAGSKDDTMEKERNLHLSQGYKDIAYNGFIEWNGTFKKGRDWENPNIDQNAANHGLNSKSLSISLAGNFELYQPSEAQLKTLIQVLATWAKRYNVPVQKSFDESWFEFQKDVIDKNTPGLWTHTTVRKDKSDMYPDKRLIDMLNRFAKKYNP